MECPSTSSSPMQVGVSQLKIYVFFIHLIGITPKIWRQIQVPSDCGFFAFHSAIQDAFGWDGTCLYSFEMFMTSPEVKSIGLPYDIDETSYEHNPVPSYVHDLFITDYFTCGGHTALYVYDVQWRFLVLLEKIVDGSVGVTYPVCVEGERTCVREGTTSMRDYKIRVNIAADSKHPLYSRVRNELATMGHSDLFNPQAVVFKNPIERFLSACEKLGVELPYNY